MVKLATWNIENLRAEPETGLNPRTLEDYARLAAVAGRLDADVIALQEVENAAAAARVFPAEAYDFFLSRREIHPTMLRARRGDPL